MKDKVVTFQIFSWAMGIILIIMGWFFSALNGISVRVDASSVSQNEIKVQLSQIQNDILWIRRAIDNQSK